MVSSRSASFFSSSFCVSVGARLLLLGERTEMTFPMIWRCGCQANDGGVRGGVFWRVMEGWVLVQEWTLGRKEKNIWGGGAGEGKRGERTGACRSRDARQRRTGFSVVQIFWPAQGPAAVTPGAQMSGGTLVARLAVGGRGP